MQIKDLLGLQIADVPEHYLQKVGTLLMALPPLLWVMLPLAL
ncbi:hypothetical protein ACLK1U_06915 [Escherichia coli]